MSADDIAIRSLAAQTAGQREGERLGRVHEQKQEELPSLESVRSGGDRPIPSLESVTSGVGMKKNASGGSGKGHKVTRVEKSTSFEDVMQKVVFELKEGRAVNKSPEWSPNESLFEVYQESLRRTHTLSSQYDIRTRFKYHQERSQLETIWDQLMEPYVSTMSRVTFDQNDALFPKILTLVSQAFEETVGLDNAVKLRSRLYLNPSIRKQFGF
jgi:hypothetical protein